MKNNKICTSCGKDKPRDEYHLRSKVSGWIQSKCKNCHKKASRNFHKNNPGKHTEYSKAQRKKNPEKFKAKAHRSRLKYLYGLSNEQFDSMFKSQNGACAICEKQNLNGKRLCVDHDHKTGKVRGLLCNQCNGFLGAISDDKSKAARAISYLEKHEDRSLV